MLLVLTPYSSLCILLPLLHMCVNVTCVLSVFFLELRLSSASSSRCILLSITYHALVLCKQIAWEVCGCLWPVILALIVFVIIVILILLLLSSTLPPPLLRCRLFITLTRILVALPSLFLYFFFRLVGVLYYG